eukprot:CAMPEP_0172446954 /NCGR_PEP_ID=MMETSP1065-20121228/6379_1 /TAXON_ID=265537 /ORGANISM="Amphiprora paludosa, Strain CCMP125" /LENGTH=1008 /DNA_ID=CAMNT_0013198143 /DNA_START=88 /DNA_END=3114 /DNA_ORIENTATION=+
MLLKHIVFLGSLLKLGLAFQTAPSKFTRSPVRISKDELHYTPFGINRELSWLGASKDTDSDSTESAETTTLAENSEPQVFASGFSSQPNLLDALREAVQTAVEGLPDVADGKTAKIDLAIVSVSSLYDGGTVQPANVVIPTILEAVKEFYQGSSIEHLVGSSVAGCISSTAKARSVSSEDNKAATSCETVELEGIPAVSITFAILPDVQLQTFTCGKGDVPDDVGRMPPGEWKRSVGLMGFGETKKVDGKSEHADEDNNTPVFMMVPSPAFSTELDDLLYGLSVYFPGSQTFGGVASTVSSLSRAKLYRYSASVDTPMTYTDGCIGVAMTGDIQVQTLSAQGAKPVGGIYQIVKGSESTIQAIVLDEGATAALEEEERDDVEEDEDEANMDEKARMAQAYAKARIPKPPLAEANFLMRTLSDDDQAFMRRQLLIGIEQGGSVGRSASELARLASGEGHRFRVFQVASGGMKDGSVTFALGSIEITPGTRARFFVRESGFAKREVEALWLGYKQNLLNNQFGKNSGSMPPPTCCFLVPTLDRGSKFFMGKSGFESGAAARMMNVNCVTGFFGNGVIGKTDIGAEAPIGVQGSASGYFMIASKSGRPLYSPAAAAAEKAAQEEQKEIERRAQELVEAEDEKRRLRTKVPDEQRSKAPRSEDGELVIKRREVHSGRAMTVSTVEWSVAEKTATPSSALEGFMWEKETEVDRFRERVPLVNLVSQCRLSAADPSLPKPRDFIGPIKQAIAADGFVVIPECKRMEPSVGSLRRRYDIESITRSLTLAKAPGISVNCDGVLFGGSLDDITKARAAASAAAVEIMSEDGVVAPPILASDLLLYPYQLYKLSLAGADAVSLVVGALPKKDLTYLIKIAASLKIQTLASVTSEVQLQALAELPKGAITAVVVSNRELEDFSVDMTGGQALKLLRSRAMEKVREVHPDIPVFAEGGVGAIERPPGSDENSPGSYLEELKHAGASGCIVGRGLVKDGMDSSEIVQLLQKQTVSASTSSS